MDVSTLPQDLSVTSQGSSKERSQAPAVTETLVSLRLAMGIKNRVISPIKNFPQIWCSNLTLLSYFHSYHSHQERASGAAKMLNIQSRSQQNSVGWSFLCAGERSQSQSGIDLPLWLGLCLHFCSDFLPGLSLTPVTPPAVATVGAFL